MKASEVIGKCASCGGDVVVFVDREMCGYRLCTCCRATEADVVLISEALRGGLFADALNEAADEFNTPDCTVVQTPTPELLAAVRRSQ